MPKCINDLSKIYRGNEISPKGFGYSSSTENIGCKMRGKDGNWWIIKQIKNGKRWNKFYPTVFQALNHQLLKQMKQMNFQLLIFII